MKLLVRGHEEMCFRQFQVSLLVLCKYYSKSNGTFTKLQPQSVIASVLRDGETIIAVSMEQFKKLRKNNQIVTDPSIESVENNRTVEPKPEKLNISNSQLPFLTQITKSSPNDDNKSSRTIMTVSPTSFGPVFSIHQ